MKTIQNFINAVKDYYKNPIEFINNNTENVINFILRIIPIIIIILIFIPLEIFQLQVNMLYVL